MEDLKELGEMVIKSLEGGLNIEAIASALSLTKPELEEIEEVFPEIRLLKRTAQLNDYLEMYELTRMGAAPASMYIHRSKTIWRKFHPQEEDTTDRDKIIESAQSILDVIEKRTNIKLPT